jgi:dolichyl-diphosphooligosaccharide---protein glycosyltransferase
MTSLVLSIVFTVAVTIRAFAAKYGFYLNEFDPYYDYYAASHIVKLAEQHGFIYALFNNPPDCAATVLTSCHSLQGYFYWHDITTWFPFGRNVAATSQDGLQVGGAVLYLLAHDVFGVQITLYNFLVLLPVFFGAISCVLFYFLVRRIGGDAAGLFSALMLAVSPPLIQRGNLGWFKSEPFAILLFVAASYLVLTVFDKDRNLRSRVIRGLSAGLLAGYSSTAWGGGDYFSAAFGLIFLILPFLNLDLASLTPAIISFTAADIFASAIFPRPGVAIVTNPVGLALISGTVFVLLGQWAKTWVKPADYRRTLSKFLLVFVLGGLTVMSFGYVGGISVRYLSVIAPWARSGNALVQSVAEQAYPTGQDYFTSYVLLLSFGVAGALIALRRRNVPMTYALVIGLTGIYFSAAYSRLLVYSSISLGLLAGVGFAELAFALVKPSTTPLVKKKPVYTTRSEMKVVFSVAVIALIAIPAGTYWIPNPISCTGSNSYFCNQSPADSGVSLVNGATTYTRSPFGDWIQTLNWIRHDTPSNAVVISWWDYGYWITVVGNRTSAADNSTLNGTRIAEIGRMFMSNATAAAVIANEIAHGRPVYVLLFITGSVFPTTNGQYYSILQVPAGGGLTAGGGDESKKQWFIRIGGLTESKYLYCPAVNVTAGCTSVDDYNLTPYALQNTLFANLLPFRFQGYLESQSSGSSTSQPQVILSQTYAPGSVEAFSYPASYLYGANSTGPFRLAYASPSISNPASCPGNSGLNCFNGVLVYQVTG